MRKSNQSGRSRLDYEAIIKLYLPGIIVAVAATLSAAYLSEHYGAPLTLMALLIGLSLNFLGADKRLAQGLTFTSRTILRWSVVLIGAKITLGQVVNLGPAVLVAIILIVVITIFSAIAVGRLLGKDSAFGVLVGGSVGICGASAAMALYTTLGEKRISRTQLTFVLVGIAAMSSLGMVIYPLVANYIGLSDRAAGFLMGASLHDVAQALGAGYSFSEPAGEIATVVKLTRVALLAPILTALVFFFPSQNTKSHVQPVPWFIAGFFILVLVNSVGLIPVTISNAASISATAMLASSVAATAIQSPMNALFNGGSRSLIIISVTSLVIFLLALLAALTVIV